MSEYEPGSGTEPAQSSTASTGVQERVKETTRGATGQVQEKAQEVKGEARERARTQLDQRTTDAGEQMRSVADALRRTGGNLQEEGKQQPAKIVEQVADRVERLGGYLTETSGDRLIRDVEDFARRRPWAIAGIGAFVGLAASRLLKASSATRRPGGTYDGGGYAPSTAPDYVPAASGPAIPATTGAPLTGPTVTPAPEDPASPGGM